MIKRSIYILFCLTALFGAQTKDAYNLDDLISGADAFGRGGAYLAADNGSSYVFQNYSLLGKKPEPRVTLTAFKLISEVNYLAAAYSYGEWGLGVMHIADNGGYIRDEDSNILGGQIGYSNTTVYGVYGHQLLDNLFLGARLKYHSVSLSEVNVQASGLALDVSELYQLNDFLLVSAELNNLLATPLQWDDYAEEQPRTLRLGGQLKAFGPQGLYRFGPSVNIYADLLVGENTSLLSGGYEFWFTEHLAWRMGLKQTSDLNTVFTRATAGLGFNWQNISIDYAYNPGDLLADNLTHFFTLSYRFSVPAKPKPPEPEIPAPPARQRIFIDLDELPLNEQALIEDLGYVGFVEGYPGKKYGPFEAMTRRELMIVLVRLLESQSKYPSKPPALLFPDTTTRNKELTDKAVSYGLLVGYTDGLARLDQPVRRDEAACAFARYHEIAGQALQNNIPYEDVPLYHWGYKDINLTRQYYLTRGINLKHFMPKDYLRRSDAAKIMGRLKYVKDSRIGLPPLEGIPADVWELLLYDPEFDLFESTHKI